MKQLKDLQSIIEQAIVKLDIPDQPVELYEPVKYILSLGGKRMRPALLLMACDLFGGDVEEALSPALAIEVFHNFTLVHDDIMDNAPLRRGKATVHERWGQNAGILSGDVMLVLAYQLMMKVDGWVLRQVLDVFNKTAVGVCEGQQLDMDFEKRQTVGIDEYLNMIRLKTSVLLGGALKIGALIGGADLADAELLYSFGEHLGIAFQLQDDILDVYGDPGKFGKQVGGDILSNKKTYLLIKALELTNWTQANELHDWINSKDFDAEQKVNAVTELYNQLNVRQYAENEMETHAEKAFKSLDEISLPAKQKQYLRYFADGLLVREN
jgi:geranylgeranyl diphosphate synthase type II